ncbi:hypothetical protein ACOME3_009418 [Neoechinorhynchus agilis]
MGFISITQIILSLLLLYRTFNCKDIFASYKQLEGLMELQKVMLDHVRNVTHDEYSKTKQLKELLTALENEIKNITDREVYAGNPINQLLIVKVLTKDKARMQEYIDRKEGIFDNLEKQFNFPDDSDYLGVVDGIFRLQDTYAISSYELGSGNLSKKYSNRPLTAAEYFEVGFNAYSNEDFYHALDWFNASIKELEREAIPTIDLKLILDYISFTTFKQGNIGHALNTTNELLSRDPNHERAKINKEFFENKIAEIMSSKSDYDLEKVLHQVSNERPQDGLQEKQDYETLCRGEGLMLDESRLSKLMCRYRDNNKPELRLQPIKEEEVFDEPKIVMYHEVLTDKDIDALKRKSEPYLERALIHNPLTSKLEPAQYRISKLCWLKDEDHPAVAKLSRLMVNLMNLTVSSAEMLQVQNYGVGGHYEPHYDFSRRSENSIFADGNRVATWLTYLTDVEKGGSTVFTPVHARVLPRKGSAVTWFNMFRSGYGDYRTRHAACPVLFGTKWVANRWLHEHGQEFIRGCSTDPML